MLDTAARRGERARPIEQVVDVASAERAWQRLAAESTNIFSTSEWASTWWRHFGRDREAFVSVLRDENGQPAGLLPLYAWRTRPLRVLRFIGHGTGDELGPLGSPDRRPAIAAALLDLLAETKADLFVGERGVLDEGWSDLIGARRLKVEASPAVRVGPDDWQTFLAGQHGTLRRSLGMKERRLFRAHEARYRLTQRWEELDRDLDTLFALHRLRWGREVTNFSRTEAFHRAFARTAFDRGWLRLWLLEIDGTPRAAWYGFRYRGVESFYQGGRDPSPVWDRYSLGLLLLAQSMRAAFEDRLDEYRLLRGGEAYKARFTSSARAVETFAISRGTRGTVALAAAARLQGTRLLGAAVSK